MASPPVTVDDYILFAKAQDFYPSPNPVTGAKQYKFKNGSVIRYMVAGPVFTLKSDSLEGLALLAVVELGLPIDPAQVVKETS
jgi:hypothetical protein